MSRINNIKDKFIFDYYSKGDFPPLEDNPVDYPSQAKIAEKEQ